MFVRGGNAATEILSFGCGHNAERGLIATAATMPQFQPSAKKQYKRLIMDYKKTDEDIGEITAVDDVTTDVRKERKKMRAQAEWLKKKHSPLVKGWERRDYGRTIFQFVLHALMLIVLFGLAVFVCENGLMGFLSYVQNPDKLRKFIFVALSIFLIYGTMYLFFFFEMNSFIKASKNIIMLFSVLGMSLIVCFIIGKYFNVYARPMAFCGLMILLLVNRRSAIIMNFVFCILMFMLDGVTIGYSEGYSSVIVGLTTGIFAIYLVSYVSSRIRVFFMGFVISVPIIVCIWFLELKSASSMLVLAGIGFTSGMSSIILMMAILPFYEKFFNVVTNYRLSEITDHKFPPIKRLIDEANGTFNHSLTVSTLAESCATAIGENALLARAAAYYHDIGKLKQPEYFSENQKGFNPHSELSPELSTDIIRSHAHDGAVYINKYHLPKILADVAEQHHGTLLIRYFYCEASKYTEEKLAEEKFSYPGPIPQTKIAAIIMICDGCEAAVRSLSDRSHENVAKMVQSIIDERLIKYRQFDDCDITIKELDIIRNTITQCLGGVYHDRVKYPDLKKDGGSTRNSR